MRGEEEGEGRGEKEGGGEREYHDPTNYSCQNPWICIQNFSLFSLTWQEL